MSDEGRPPRAPLPPRDKRKPALPNPVTTPKEPREGYTAVGRVLRPHALRGEVRASAFSASALNLQVGRTVYLAGTPRKILRARPDREAWILQLDGINDRNLVEQLRGELLEAPDAEVERDDEDSYFIHELIGLRVETVEGERLGTLSDVMQPGANDVYVVADDSGEELLIPAIGDVIERIDLLEGVMRVNLQDDE